MNAMELADFPDLAGFSRANPTYLQIKNVIRKLISNGDLPEGAMLPGERDLAARWGAGRETVRRALKELEEAGLVEIKPGIGCQVIATCA